MEFSRDAARVTHTFEFITAVAYLTTQYPHHKLETVATLLNDLYYKKERRGITIEALDVWLAMTVIKQEPPSWPEGLLFYSEIYGIPYTREEYAELNKPNYKTIVHLAKNVKKAMDYRINALSVINNTLTKIDGELYYKEGTTLSYWKDNRFPKCDLVVNTVRNLLVDGRNFKRYWEAQFWFMPKREDYAIPLLFKRIDVQGKPNAVKVYVRTRKHRLCICTRKSYLLAGI